MRQFIDEFDWGPVALRGATPDLAPDWAPEMTPALAPRAGLDPWAEAEPGPARVTLPETEAPGPRDLGALRPGAGPGTSPDHGAAGGARDPGLGAQLSGPADPGLAGGRDGRNDGGRDDGGRDPSGADWPGRQADAERAIDHSPQGLDGLPAGLGAWDGLPRAVAGDAPTDADIAGFLSGTPTAPGETIALGPGPWPGRAEGDRPEPGSEPGAEPGSGGSEGPVQTYVSGAGDGSGYNVEITFSGSWSAALQQAFIGAADFLSAVILSDLPAVAGSFGLVDDVRIDAALVAIDGAGGVLGQAGPTLVRSAGYLPAEGLMQFDEADAAAYDAAGLWDDIVLHEMMHAIGFGTMWSWMGLVQGSPDLGEIRFLGDFAAEMYRQEFPLLHDSDPAVTRGVPVEATGGPGTAGGHWDEFLFTDEIMTGYVDGSNHLSLMSLAALEDMGYDTVLDNPFLADDLTGPLPADPLSGAGLLA